MGPCIVYYTELYNQWAVKFPNGSGPNYYRQQEAAWNVAKSFAKRERIIALLHYKYRNAVRMTADYRPAHEKV